MEKTIIPEREEGRRTNIGWKGWAKGIRNTIDESIELTRQGKNSNINCDKSNFLMCGNRN